MKKIIPFRKEVVFDTNLYEITSISLENTLHKENNMISGNFIVSGEYRVTDTSITTLPFTYDLPVTVDIDDIYDISDSVVDVDDFYYEIVNNKVLVINITLKLDQIKEFLLERNDTMEEVENIKLDNTKLEDVKDNNVEINNINIDNVTIDDSKPVKEIKEDTKKSLFSDINNDDNYVNYHVYIVRENDSVESIMSKYNVTKDMLADYNDLTNIKIGDKIIIPYVKN